MIGRREFSVGSLAAASLLATRASACQPPDVYDRSGIELHQALANGAVEQVEKLFDPSAELYVIDASQGFKAISGPQQISEFFLNLVHKEGYHFAPNTTGKYQEGEESETWGWKDDFGWQKASLWKPVFDDPDAPRLYALDGCGSFYSDSFNLLVHESPIKSVALIREELPEKLKAVAREHERRLARKGQRNG